MCPRLPLSAFCAQANSGGPCGIASAKRAGLKTCPHTHIVGLAVLGDGYATGDQEVEEHEEHVVGKEAGTARAEWAGPTRSAFTSKMLHLLKVMGVLKFPIEPEAHLSDHALNTVLVGDSLITCHESVCSVCEKAMSVTENKPGIAVTQVSSVYCNFPSRIVWFKFCCTADCGEP